MSHSRIELRTDEMGGFLDLTRRDWSVSRVFFSPFRVQCQVFRCPFCNSFGSWIKCQSTATKHSVRKRPPTNTNKHGRCSYITGICYLHYHLAAAYIWFISPFLSGDRIVEDMRMANGLSDMRSLPFRVAAGGGRCQRLM